MLDIDVDFYKDLFGKQEKMDISLEHKYFAKVSKEENAMLNQCFSDEEIRDVASSYAEEDLTQIS